MLPVSAADFAKHHQSMTSSSLAATSNRLYMEHHRSRCLESVPSPSFFREANRPLFPLGHSHHMARNEKIGRRILELDWACKEPPKPQQLMKTLAGFLVSCHAGGTRGEKLLRGRKFLSDAFHKCRKRGYRKRHSYVSPKCNLDKSDI